MLILRNAEIVVGDGRTRPFRGSIAIEDGVIAAVSATDLAGGPTDIEIDLGGRLAVPGGIDIHAHATAPGPRFASGTPGVSLAESLGNLRRHLGQGHTTVVDLDGFKVLDDNAQVRGVQPVKVELSTIHFEPMFEAADACDGSGLAPEHRAMTAARMAEHGAVVIGEVGAGMTLGGGGQDYIYIPAAIEKATGVRISQPQAQALKFAALGRHIRPGTADRARLSTLLTEYGLVGLDVEGLIALVEQSVLPSFAIALDGVVRSAQLARDLELPTLVHNSAPSDEAVREAAAVAGELFIGGHTNHSTYDTDETLASARWIREQGGFIEVDTFDAWSEGTGVRRTPERLIALAQEGLIDIVATDYAAGHWDGVWELVAGFVQMRLVPIEKAVALVTGNVARALPRIGRDRGLLRAGSAADIVVTAPGSLADIALVLVDGVVVYSSGPRPLAPSASPWQGVNQEGTS